MVNIADALRDPGTVLIEVPGAYDGWSILQLADGTQINRWADEAGNPVPGYERRFYTTQKAMRGEEQ